MPLIQYEEKNLRPKTLEVIERANEIIADYQSQGFDLTLRQLFYQFVSRGLIPNTQKEYKNLGSAINDGRLAGLVDWESIVDRTRELRSLPHWTSPRDIVKACGGPVQPRPVEGPAELRRGVDREGRARGRDRGRL